MGTSCVVLRTGLRAAVTFVALGGLCSVAGILRPVAAFWGLLRPCLLPAFLRAVLVFETLRGCRAVAATLRAAVSLTVGGVACTAPRVAGPPYSAFCYSIACYSIACCSISRILCMRAFRSARRSILVRAADLRLGGRFVRETPRVVYVCV